MGGSHRSPQGMLYCLHLVDGRDSQNLRSRAGSGGLERGRSARYHAPKCITCERDFRPRCNDREGTSGAG